MKVLILYSLSPDDCDPGRFAYEFDMTAAVEGIAHALPDSIVAGVRGELSEVIAAVERYTPDVVFNLCEAPLGRPDLEHHVAAVLEWIGVPFTGSGSETLALCRRKDRTNAVLSAAGVPVPRSGRFPCIVKPMDQDGSFGILSNSVCVSEEEVVRATRNFAGPALVEEFLPGREFAVSLWGKRSPEFAAMGETIFLLGMSLNTYAAKWCPDGEEYENTPMRYDTAVDPVLREAVLDAARSAWMATDARGYLRVDVRQDPEGTPRVMDVNPNPALSPGIGVGRAAVESGWTWAQLVAQLVQWAC